MIPCEWLKLTGIALTVGALSSGCASGVGEDADPAPSFDTPSTNTNTSTPPANSSSSGSNTSSSGSEGLNEGGGSTTTPPVGSAPPTNDPPPGEDPAGADDDDGVEEGDEIVNNPPPENGNQNGGGGNQNGDDDDDDDRDDDDDDDGGNQGGGNQGGGDQGGGDQGGGAQNNVTFATVYPILVTNCGRCHANGGLPQLANANIETAFNVARREAGEIVSEIRSGGMPADTCNGAPGSAGCVSQADFATIQAWVNAGTPR